MPYPPDPVSTPLKGQAAAWLGGIVMAVAAASLTFSPDLFGFGMKYAAVVDSVVLLKVPALPAFWMALAAGMAAVWMGVAIAPARRVAALLAVLACLDISQSYVLVLYGLWWGPLPAVCAVLAGGGAAVLLRAASTSPASLFQRRLSPAALATLAKARDVSFLHPDQREATVLTCRLLNENALREQLPAPEFLKLCETFRARASALLLERGACLDAAEPGGVRAFFGLPLASAAPADEAVRAALALDEAMRGWSASLSPAQGSPVCGTGLATGTLTAGVTGSAYTVLGDAVELSRWLALQNSSYQTGILLDAATHLVADAVQDRPLEFINPPEGAAVEIFQLLGSDASLSRDADTRRHAFRDAIILLRAGHAEDAARRFDDARPAPPAADPVLEYFVSMARDQSLRDAASLGPAQSANPQPVPPPTARRPGKPSRKLPRRP